MNSIKYVNYSYIPANILKMKLEMCSSDTDIYANFNANSNVKLINSTGIHKYIYKAQQNLAIN